LNEDRYINESNLNVIFCSNSAKKKLNLEAQASKEDVIQKLKTIFLVNKANDDISSYNLS